MATKFINAASFIETGRRPAYSPTSEYEVIDGTVEVTLRGQTKREPAVKLSNSDVITAKGLLGRYSTGSKAWPACIHEWVAGDGTIVEFVSFGRDDRHPKFKKENCIFFA